MKLNHGLHLAYCTNVHRGETWPEMFDSLKTHTLAVRERVCPKDPYAIGLRLSNRAAVRADLVRERDVGQEEAACTGKCRRVTAPHVPRDCGASARRDPNVGEAVRGHADVDVLPDVAAAGDFTARRREIRAAPEYRGDATSAEMIGPPLVGPSSGDASK